MSEVPLYEGGGVGSRGTESVLCGGVLSFARREGGHVKK